MKKRILSSLLSKRPAHLILHVTNKCNLRCKTCFVDFEKYKEKEITLEEVEALSRFLKRLLWLDISGGEPFLRQDLPEICSLFDAKVISIPTNGFNPELIFEMTESIRSKTSANLMIDVSLDGFQETNDAMRNKGCFEKSVETLKTLKRMKDVKIKVNTVLCEKNYAEIIDFMKFIKTLEPDFHSVIFLRGKPRDPTYRRPSVDKLEEIKDSIFSIWSTYNYGLSRVESKILQSYQILMYETSLRILKDKRQIPPCVAGSRHLVIYPNGDVSSCEILQPFGNIREQPIHKVLESGRAVERKKHIKAQRCNCYHNCNMIDNFFLNPTQYPRLFLGMLK